MNTNIKPVLLEEKNRTQETWDSEVNYVTFYHHIFHHPGRN